MRLGLHYLRCLSDDRSRIPYVRKLSSVIDLPSVKLLFFTIEREIYTCRSFVTDESPGFGAGSASFSKRPYLRGNQYTSREMEVRDGGFLPSDALHRIGTMVTFHVTHRTNPCVALLNFVASLSFRRPL